MEYSVPLGPMLVACVTASLLAALIAYLVGFSAFWIFFCYYAAGLTALLVSGWMSAKHDTGPTGENDNADPTE